MQKILNGKNRSVLIRVILIIIFLLLCASAALADDAQDLTSECKFRTSETEAFSAYNDSMPSTWKSEGTEATIQISLPDSGAAYIEICWMYTPEDFTITQYREDRSEITARSRSDDDYGFLTQLYDLDPEARFVYIGFAQQGQWICRIRIYSSGELPITVQKWEAPYEDCDLMVISTHMDDEWLWFGAIIPYYELIQGRKTQVVYMANCGRKRYQEALDALATAGITHAPIFIGLKDEKKVDYQTAIADWGGYDGVLSQLAGVIRQHKPEVILTHDWDGEYGHIQHVVTSRAMQYAIEAAADPSKYTDSVEQYGTWQVSKLYRHLEKDQQIEFDWHVAYPEFRGLTGIEIATEAMNCNVSQLSKYQVEDHGKYDNSLFGLSWSNIGDDVLHNDLFENIETTSSTGTMTGSSSETASGSEITAADTTSLTDAATDTMVASVATTEDNVDEITTDISSESPDLETQSAETSAGAETKTEHHGGFPWPMFPIAAVVIFAVLYILRCRQLRQRKRRRRRRTSYRDYSAQRSYHSAESRYRGSSNHSREYHHRYDR